MNHIKYMRRCLQLAKKGVFTTPPNPMVGSVVVYDDKIIGEGYHIKPGLPHAEINAINSVKEKHLLDKSTLYVNLEPCSHYGKTPPCALKIAELGIKEVVIGVKDYSSKVNGKGIKILQDAGVKVTVGVLKEEAFEINKRFFVNQLLNRPFIILKWAQTADGFIDYLYKKERKINWITDDYSKLKVHKQRSEVSAVLVGAETIRKDNPMLTVREWYATRQPKRIVFLSKLTNDMLDAHIFEDLNSTIIVNFAPPTNYKFDDKINILEAYGKSLSEVLLELYEKYNVYSVVVEGGKKTLETFINSGLWDEAYIFTGFVKFGKGIEAPQIKGTVQNYKFVDDIATKVLRNPVYESFVDRFQ